MESNEEQGLETKPIRSYLHENIGKLLHSIADLLHEKASDRECELAVECADVVVRHIQAMMIVKKESERAQIANWCAKAWKAVSNASEWGDEIS